MLVTNYLIPKYNGAISGIIWKTRGSGVNRKYDFEYDNTDQMIAATFYQQSGSGWDNNGAAGSNININYSVGGNGASGRYIEYDDNGNLKSMWQKGLKLNNSSLIDNLQYDYGSNGNKLTKVTDAANDPNSTLNDFKDEINTGDDYSYNLNGNLIVDNNKKITNITYNFQNLPELITFYR